MERLRCIINILVLFLVFIFCSAKSYATRESEMMEKIEATQAVQQKGDLGETIRRPEVEYAAGGLKDPFRSYLREVAPVSYKKEEQRISEKALPSLKVQGVIWGGNFPQAIINNKVVKVGDSIEQVKIIKIDQDGIRVLFEGREYDLSSPAKIRPEEAKEGKTTRR